MKPHVMGCLLMRHASMPKEAFVRWLVHEGYTEEEIKAIRDEFTKSKTKNYDGYKKVF